MLLKSSQAHLLTCYLWLHVYYVWFLCTTTAELRSHNWGHMTCKSKIFTIWPFTEQVLILGLESMKELNWVRRTSSFVQSNLNIFQRCWQKSSVVYNHTFLVNVIEGYWKLAWINVPCLAHYTESNSLVGCQISMNDCTEQYEISFCWSKIIKYWQFLVVHMIL